MSRTKVTHVAGRKKGRDPGLARVRSVIAGLAMAGTISLESVARNLETSPRTLQRRLRQRGVGFWSLVEQCRFEISSALLRETDLKIEEIAATIGYGTPSAFSRAFSRWSGHSPSEHRRACVTGNQGMSNWREMGRSVRFSPLGCSSRSDVPEET